ncbi:MAG: carbohydrate kinase [Clostridia bacterium]
MYDISAIGELLVDFTECGSSASGMRLFEQNAGGAVTNMLAAAARCGASTAFLGKVGSDMHGYFLKKAMEDAGVDMRGLVMADDVFTTMAFVALAQNGERQFSFARKPGADACICESELDKQVLHNTRILHTGSLSLTDEPARTATYRAIEIAKAAGAIITYDPNYRASLWHSRQDAAQGMRSLIATADIIKLSDEETALLTGESDPELASNKLCNAGASIVAVTLGANGALVRVGSQIRRIPGFLANVVDTTGAGDAFFGGFLYSFLQSGIKLEHVSIHDAADFAEFGNAVASLCVERRGGIPAMPALGDVISRMREQERPYKESLIDNTKKLTN